MNIATAAEWKALVYLADNMKANRTVSVPRSTIAHELGISASEVTQRIKAAREAGLLDTVVPARRHAAAVYRGISDDEAR